VGVTGSIAAYKTAEVVSGLVKSGKDVQVILTDSACKFVSPLTFATLSRSPAYTDREFWQASHGRPLHISLAEWADVLLIAPLSANSLGKLALGLADNLLMNVVLASRCPVVLAPAMNTVMWEQPIVQHHLHQLKEDDRFIFLSPTAGRLACDTVGMGRMAEPARILDALTSVLWTGGRQDLKGKRILVTAGGTREYIDRVRFIGNPSTGKQGVAIAQAACHRGAEVTLVYANGTMEMTECKTLAVTTAAEMATVLQQEFDRHDWLIMAAAVGDVRPPVSVSHKIPKEELGDTLLLERVPDLVAGLAQQKGPSQKVIGFAAQTGSDEEMIAKGRAKLVQKQLDAIVINAIDRAYGGFGATDNQVFFLSRSGRLSSYPLASKLEIAHRLLNDLLVEEG
jgi:phosphopantothenoylcysteine decarboxylase/phosphopantothenate--cysteine ligase